MLINNIAKINKQYIYIYIWAESIYVNLLNYHNIPPKIFMSQFLPLPEFILIKPNWRCSRIYIMRNTLACFCHCQKYLSIFCSALSTTIVFIHFLSNIFRNKSQWKMSWKYIYFLFYTYPVYSVKISDKTLQVMEFMGKILGIYTCTVYKGYFILL